MGRKKVKPGKQREIIKVGLTLDMSELKSQPYHYRQKEFKNTNLKISVSHLYNRNIFSIFRGFFKEKRKKKEFG